MTERLSAEEKPRRKRIRLPLDAYHKPEAWYFLTICCRDKAPLFETSGARDVMRQALLETATIHSVEIATYTILPNHTHLICSAGRKGLIAFVRDFKLRATTEFRRRYGHPSPWQKSFFDHKIRSEESFQQKCDYVLLNPVRRGLAAKPEEYPWSGSFLHG